MIIAINKPYGVITQFSPEPESSYGTLADYNLPANVYPVGRLDADSEGLLILSDEPGVNNNLLDPVNGHKRTYLVQVEGVITEDALLQLQQGVVIKDYRTQPCQARAVDPEPALPERVPPVRFRKSKPTSWMQLTLTEGKNRQVRKMTAAVGFPTLRLIRVQIGDLRLESLGLDSGVWRELTADERRDLFR